MKKKRTTRALFKHHSIAIPGSVFNAHWNLGYSVIAVKDEHATIPDLLGDAYSVTVDNKGQFFISCVNGSRIGLTWLDGKTLNGKESEFFFGGQS